MTHQAGNVHDHDDTRGWLVGSFAEGIARTEGVEVKWGTHPAGEQRAGWSSDARTTLLLLVSGRFRLDLPDQSHTLTRPGDYVLWAGEPHSWQAMDDSTVVTVRWATT